MRYRKFFFVMLAIVILGSLTSLVTPFFLQFWGGTEEGLSIQRILILLVVMVISKIMSIVFTIYRERFAKEYNKKNFTSMLSRFLKMDYDSINKEGPASILERIAMSVNSIYAYMTGGYIQIWSSAVIMVACLVFIAKIDYRAALILLVIIPVNYFGYKLLNKELARRAQQMQQQTGTGFQEILSRVQQVDYIKQSADYNEILKTLESSTEKIYGSMARVNEYAQSITLMLEGVNEIARNAILIYMVYSIMNMSLSPYSLVLFTLILPLYFSGLGMIVKTNVNRHDFLVALNFQKEMDEKTERDGQCELSSIDEVQLEVKSVEVPGKTIPFEAVAALKKGDIVKICGASGTGKSSFAKSLIKFRSIQGVSFNGIPISNIMNHDLRECVEYLSQDVSIIKGSLRENLFFNREFDELTEKRYLAESLLQTILADKTLDTEILEGGANLSGGEKQKIALARALAKNTDMLILDEICSNIDKASSDAIYERIAKDRWERITIIITHDDLPEGLVNIELNRNS